MNFTRLLLFAIVAVLPAGCDEPKPQPELAAPSASVPSAPEEKPFDLPDPKEVKLDRVGDWVDRARSKLPTKDIGKLDAWLGKAVRMPVEVRGESRKTLSETGELTCGYVDKLSCSFPGKLSKASKHFVASTMVCVDKDGAAVKRADWRIPRETKREEVVALPVDDGLLRGCWEQGGVSLRLEVVGSPCVVPFPRQVRCAGEYNTCLYRCKGSESCEQTCDVNRRKCLAVCK